MNTPTKATPADRPTSPREAYVSAERERAIALLTDRYAEGAIDDAMLERHLDRLHSGDLSAIEGVVAELNAPRPIAPLPVARPSAEVTGSFPSLGEPRRVLAIMSESKRTGRWTVPPELRVVAVMSDVKLDLRHAALPPFCEIHVTCVMANVQLTVPPGLPVIFEADGFIGTATSSAIEPDTTTHGAIVRVVGSAVLGEIRVSVKEGKAR